MFDLIQIFSFLRFFKTSGATKEFNLSKRDCVQTVRKISDFNKLSFSIRRR